MRMRKTTIGVLTYIFTAFLLVFECADMVCANDTQIKIGVLAKRGIVRCMEKWTPTAKYLTTKIPGKTFVIIPVDSDGILSFVEFEKIDFVLANPSVYVELENGYGVNRIATLENRRIGQVVTKSGGLIFCRAYRKDIQTLNDIKGKTFMAARQTSFGGWRMAFREFKEKGIDPYSDFKGVQFGGMHDTVVYAVRDGKVDAGTVRTDTLERMDMDGKIDVKRFRIINNKSGKHEDFPFILSTRLYPEWPFAKLKHISNELAEKVAIALLEMPADSAAAIAAKCSGWTIPLNYQPVHECLKELRLGPYKDFGKITPSAVVKKYWVFILAIAILFAAVSGAAVFILRLNRNIRKTHIELQSEVEERKQAKEGLQESEERLKIAGKVAYDLIYEWTVEDDKLEWFGNIDEILGYKPKEILRTIDGWMHLIHPEDIDLLKDAAVDHRTSTVPISYEYRVKHKNGSWRSWSDNSMPMLNYKGLPYKRIGVCTDITERKQIEASLQESEENYRSLITNIPDITWRTDINGNTTFISPNIEKVYGYSPEEIYKYDDELWFGKIHSDDINKVKESFERLLTEGAQLDVEYRIQRRDGKWIWVRDRSTGTLEKNGLKFAEGILSDITEYKLSEEERKKLEAQLQQAQKMETIGILAGGVAHDLNNILSGIISYPELLLLDLPEDSPLRKPLLTIQTSGEKAAVVVQDLLTLARRGVTITEIVNLNSIISEQLESPEYEKLKSFHPNVDINTNLEKDLLNIKGSTAHLGKTVFNLISNAAEAMPDGGNLFISTENLYIDRPIRGYDHVAEGDYVTVTVSDTGIGISEEDMKRIFEPFYTKKVMGKSGSGLGMSVVWGTVKDHNGYIDVESTKGKRTTFTLYFPVTREELAIDKSLLSIEDYMGKGESILIVDDVEEQREIASGMLKKLGYLVKSVSSGEEAIEYIKDNSVDLLVLDMIMDPGIDGFDTYKKILELHPGQKAIIASGFSETDRVKAAQRLGAEKYIKKPYTLEKIGLAVKEALGE